MERMVRGRNCICIIFYVYHACHLLYLVVIASCLMFAIYLCTDMHAFLVALTSNPLHNISVPLSPMGISSERTIFFLTSSLNYKSDMKMWLPRQ